MKRAIAECFFPELKGPSIYKTGRGEASNAKAAISRAMGHALKQVKGKRWSTVKVTFSVSDVVDITPEDKDLS
jgi:hypothetical protein